MFYQVLVVVFADALVFDGLVAVFLGGTFGALRFDGTAGAGLACITYLHTNGRWYT